MAAYTEAPLTSWRQLFDALAAKNGALNERVATVQAQLGRARQPGAAPVGAHGGGRRGSGCGHRAFPFHWPAVFGPVGWYRGMGNKGVGISAKVFTLVNAALRVRARRDGRR
jgi:hypothetical protein